MSKRSINNNNMDSFWRKVDGISEKDIDTFFSDEEFDNLFKSRGDWKNKKNKKGDRNE